MKPVPNLVGYYADELGNIYSTKSHKHETLVDKPHKLNGRYIGKPGNDYRAIHVVSGPINHWVKVSHLVLETFVGPRPVGMIACHGSGGRHDDSLANLYWGTHKQNANDKLRDGTVLFGEKNHKSKLTAEKVRWLRKHFMPHDPDGPTLNELAVRFKVKPLAISRAIRLITWRHI